MNKPYIPLNETKILSGLSNKSLILNIQQSVGSTNTYIKQLPITYKKLICIAEQQTQGRGRLERSWYSPFGENIYFSQRIPFQGQLNQLPGFSLIVSLAVIQTLQLLPLPNPIQVKWPNDLLYESKKLAGVLVEIDKLSNEYFLTIGIGINVNMLESDINQAWTSLKKITAETYDRNLLITALIQQLENHIALFFQYKLSYCFSEYQKHDALINNQITMQMGSSIYKGTCKGINAEGLLILQEADGTVRLFAAGEASILKD